MAFAILHVLLAQPDSVSRAQQALRAMRRALAAASANCLSAFPGSFSPSDAEEITRGIRMEKRHV